MANTAEVETLVDGPRNVVAKVDIECTSADLSSTVLLDPAALNATNPPTNQLRIDEIQYSVEDGWYVTLFWDASTPVIIVTLSGRGMFPVGPNFGAIQNNAGAGKTGKITATTTGYSSGTMAATFILHCVKESA
jgi:hypothetical protein